MGKLELGIWGCWAITIVFRPLDYCVKGGWVTAFQSRWTTAFKGVALAPLSSQRRVQDIWNLARSLSSRLAGNIEGRPRFSGHDPPLPLPPLPPPPPPPPLPPPPSPLLLLHHHHHYHHHQYHHHHTTKPVPSEYYYLHLGYHLCSTPLADDSSSGYG
ncbi:hypothetical protein HZH68_008265 [Vespula germanica]|uniref:Uncharacterized protein n=1 Tax=Vespula germanica TaxID=30212 RepID=A0A834K3X0_VESGE|nr:hypothetical protein HZH68_008265 [Vespula germanica]